MKSKKVYLVTAGEYSDYRVLGVFSTKDKAIAFVDSMKAIKYHYEEPRIEEFQMDAQISNNKNAYYVKLENGDVVAAVNLGKDSQWISELSRPRFWVPEREQEDIFCGYLWAKSQEHAIKIVSDEWFQYQALGVMDSSTLKGG